jgi:hypothetical protein
MKFVDTPERGLARAAREEGYTVQAGVPTRYTRPLGMETTEGYRGVVNCLLCGAAVLLLDADSTAKHNAWHDGLATANAPASDAA